MGLRLKAAENLVKRFKKIDPDKLLQGVIKASTSLQQDIVALNTEDQLYDKGITVDGVTLGDYSAATIEGTSNFLGKKQKGQRYDHITLSDTGEFYQSFKIKVEAHDFFISADTKKPEVDLLTYGNIVGLTPENKMVVGGWVKAPFMSAMRKVVFR